MSLLVAFCKFIVFWGRALRYLIAMMVITLNDVFGEATLLFLRLFLSTLFSLNSPFDSFTPSLSISPVL